MYSETDILRAVCSSLDEAILVIDPDTRSIVHCNSSVSRIFGYERNELIGRSTRILHVDDASHAEFGRLSERVLDAKEVFRTEYRMRRKSGSVFPAEIVTTPIIPEESWLSGVVSVVRDVTRKKKDDEARRRNQQRLHLILDQVPAIVWTTDRELRITSIMGHQSTMISEDPQSLVGTTLHELLEENEEAQSTIEAHNRALSGEPGEYEINYAGTLFVGRTEPLFEGGELTGVVGLGYDISAQRRYEDELKSSIREREILIQEIRHRVKNNLQLVRSMLSIHSATATNREARLELTTAMRRVNSLTTAYNLLITRERVGFVQMGEYLSSITEELTRPEERAIEIVTEVEDLELHLDAAVPCGIIVNELATLSLCHSLGQRQSGTLRIGMRSANEEVIITVEDNGTDFLSPDAEAAERPDTTVLDALISQIEATMVAKPGNGMSVEVRFTPQAPYTD